MADPTAQNVMDDARTHLNDANGIRYPNATLLPVLKIAWDELELHLAQYNIPVLQKMSVETTVPAGTTEIPGPTDLIAPLKIEEKAVGAPDDQYVEIFSGFWEGIELPAAAWLGRFAWREQKFFFPNHTEDRAIRIFYIGSLLTLADENSQLQVHNCKVVLAKRTAGIAARDLGANPTRGRELNDEASYFLNMLLAVQVKTRQAQPVRRRGYGSTRRRSFFFG